MESKLPYTRCIAVYPLGLTGPEGVIHNSRGPSMLGRQPGTPRWVSHAPHKLASINDEDTTLALNKPAAAAQVTTIPRARLVPPIPLAAVLAPIIPETAVAESFVYHRDPAFSSVPVAAMPLGGHDCSSTHKLTLPYCSQNTVKGQKRHPRFNACGCKLWAAALVLSSYISKFSGVVKHKFVLELGSGSGLCGLTAWHCKATRTVLTDGNHSTLKLLRHNAAKRSSQSTAGTNSLTNPPGGHRRGGGGEQPCRA